MKRHLAVLGIAGSLVLISLFLAGSLGSQATGGEAVVHERGPGEDGGVVPTVVGGQPLGLIVLIEALYYDGYASYEPDEAFRLMNLSPVVAVIGGWSVTNQLQSTRAIFPPGTTLAPGQAIWCARQALAFEQQFGFKADFEAGDTDPGVPELEGAWPPFANTGSRCLLRDAGDQAVDVLVYEGGSPDIDGWDGPAVNPWSPSTYFGAEGQILYRKRDQISGLPVPDTDTAADWAQDPDDPIDGRKVQYPGWDLDPFFQTARVTETAVLTVAVGPDHLLEAMLAQIERAQDSIRIEGYTFESAALAQALVDRLASGVSVTLLLEGSPAGGASPAQRWICGQIRDAGGQIYFLYSGDYHSRYRFLHAKSMLVDGRWALIGSENLNPTGMPADDKVDGTAGRRGVYLITDAPGVVARIQAILAADLDPAHHGDLVTCADVPDLCIGSPPLPEPNWTSYTVAFSQPLAIEGEFAFEVIQSPENSLRTVDGLLGLIGRAGPGDEILIQQFYEQRFWGSDTQPDPNPRLEAYLEAARRGAAVRILLDGFVSGDYQNPNQGTVDYLRSVAQAEGLDLEARLANPTHLGLHNKMVLVRVGGEQYVHVGSINGSEVSSKANRELALQVRSAQAHEYLRAVFEHDWRTATPPIYLPLVSRAYRAPEPANHLLVSEVLYDVSKEEEWVELVNPTTAAVDLSAYKIGDAERPFDFEGMYRFPAGTALAPRQVLVIASSALAFQQRYGWAPDLEFYGTDPNVPDLIPFSPWGMGEWELRGTGDEVLLLDAQNKPVDVLVYGDGIYPGVVPHPGVSLFTHSLERYPPWFDTDDCSLDFRDWPFPNPGELP